MNYIRYQLIADLQITNNMHLIEVITKSEKKEFIDFPKRLYKGDPFWVCQLDSGIESVFDPRKTILLYTAKQHAGFSKMIMVLQLEG